MIRFARFRRRVADGPLDCRTVGRVLQQALDAEGSDDLADRVAAHLEDCLQCGMEADVYLRIKASLARRSGIDPTAATRLRAFGHALVSHPPGDGPAPGGPPGPAGDGPA